MPGNGLTFAIRVGCENDAIGPLDGVGDLGKPLGTLAVRLPVHGEIFVRADGAILRRQITHMAIGGKNSKPEPRYLLMVFALAGDSTMTTFISPSL